jgi:hypothetical protein
MIPFAPANVTMLDQLQAVIPMVPFNSLDIQRPALVRVLVDSDTAAQMLEKNVKNRRQRRAAVEYLKHQIATGEWRDDHPQPVIFSNAGRLIDGQHRLQAIAEMQIQSSNALIVRVETGARDDVREYLDTGVPRSLDDRVELVEDPHANKIIAQLCAAHLQMIRQSHKKPSPEDAREFFEQHKEACYFIARNKKNDKGTGRIQIALAAMEYFERTPKKAQEFYPALFLIDSEIQQARVLRDYALRSNYGSSNSGSIRGDMYRRAVGCMKAHQRGRKIKIVRAATWD